MWVCCSFYWIVGIVRKRIVLVGARDVAGMRTVFGKILDESIDGGRNGFAPYLEFREIVVGEISEIKGEVRLGLDFPNRAAGDVEKRDKRLVGSTVKAFGNVRRHRDDSPLNLVAEGKVR